MSKTSKYLLMIGIYLFLSSLFLIGIECGLRAFGYGVDFLANSEWQIFISQQKHQ